ncbi:hypothetical protein M1494_02870 [Candidatus Parvarchaeota archaeon]|nr:hypothetical protein [Candidatus Parvarchaeota archaeon]
MQRIQGWEIFANLLKQNKSFVTVPLVIFSAYVYLFMHDQVGISAFSFLYPVFDIICAFLLSFTISLIIAINYYIIKARKNANKRNTGWAIFFSLLSTPFCCNVLIPLFIAFIFGSAALSPVYDTAQRLLVEYDPLIIVISIVIIYIFYERSLNAFIGCKIKLPVNKNLRSLG